VRDSFLTRAGIEAVPPASEPTNLSEMELTVFFLSSAWATLYSN
jgi:hypothetical protein